MENIFSFLMLLSTLISLANGEPVYLDDTVICLRWSPASGNVDHYNMEVTYDGGRTWIFVGSTPTAAAPTIEQPFCFKALPHIIFQARAWAVDSADRQGPRSDWSDKVISIPDDLNLDEAVDIIDAAMVALGWGKNKGEEGYNPRADINDDGTIDILDATVIAVNWGIKYDYSGITFRVIQ